MVHVGYATCMAHAFFIHIGGNVRLRPCASDAHEHVHSICGFVNEIN